MCGRFTVTTKDTKTIADRFQVELEKALERGPAGGGGGDGAPAAKESAEAAKDDGGKKKEKAPPGLGRYNVAPTQPIAIVRVIEGKRQFALVQERAMDADFQG